MTKKYFVASDIHSFFSVFKARLLQAGWNINNPDHILVLNGDLWDRGYESVELYNFIKEIPKEQRIIIKGNHEGLYLELLEKDYPEPHDFSNGTVKTFCQIADMIYSSDEWPLDMDLYLKSSCRYSYGTYFDNVTIDPKAKEIWLQIREKVKNHEITEWIKSDEWRDYLEIDKFIITHSFIPITDLDQLPPWYTENRKQSINPDWRNASEAAWNNARWGCPWKQFNAGLFNKEIEAGKTLVCGHWHASDFHHVYENIEDNDEIYFGENLIALDACTVRSMDCNILIIDENYRCFNYRGEELKVKKPVPIIETVTVDELKVN